MLVFALSLFCVLSCAGGVAFASEGSGPTLASDMEQLDNDLKSNSTLSDFSTFSTAHRNEDDYALADVAFNEYQLTGADPMLGYLAPSPTGPALEPIEHYIEDLKTGVETLIPGGSVDDEIGAAVGEEGAAAGVIGAVATLIPITGYLTYEDIVTGSNVVTRALFSGQEDDAEGISPGAEKERWERYPTTKCTIGGSVAGVDRCMNQYWTEQCGSLASECAEADLFAGSPFHGAGREAEGIGLAGYYLEYEVSGKYYATSLAFYNPQGTYEANKYKETNESEGCFIESIAGAPVSFIKNPATELVPESAFRPAGECEHYYLDPETGEYVLGSKGEQETKLQAYVDADTLRTPSRMHEGLPHKKILTEVEKLEKEGAIAAKNEGHPAKSSTEVKERVKGVKISESEGGKERQKEAYCHWMGCETVYQPASPETLFEPARPEKPEGQSPDLPGTATVPSCFLLAMTGPECVTLLETDGFTDVELDPRTWENADLQKSYESVISVDPAGGSIVEVTTHIEVEDNPDEEKYPLAIPPPHPGETAPKYKERLEKEGWTKVTVKPALEPSTGVHPGEVSKVDPSPETRLNPETVPKTNTEVKIEEQPESSPQPGLPPGAAVGSPGCGLEPPTAALNLSPITGHRFGSIFPFSILTWLGGLDSGIASASAEPHFILTVFGWELETGSGEHGFYLFHAIITLFRMAMAAFLWIGAAWFLWNRTIGTRTS
ncbi:MAG TPA: hypothetical protein VFW38_01935 [Solirubrobacteraceae bacterium]|nr:hypothetical protein [Solirubrobacteraceae bacterium]